MISYSIYQLILKNQGEAGILHERLFELCNDITEQDFLEALQQLMQEGIIYEPRLGFYKVAKELI